MQPPVIVDPRAVVRAAERDGQYEIEVAIAGSVPFLMRVFGWAYAAGNGLGWMHLSDFVLGSLITTVLGPMVAGVWKFLRPRR